MRGMHFTGASSEAGRPTFAARRHWLAIRGHDPQRVLAALPILGAERASWRSCAEALDGPRLLVSRPSDGWIVVLGGALPGPGHPLTPGGGAASWFPDRATPLVVDLSRRLGTVQYFAAAPAFDLHAWAWAEGGQIVRSFAYAGASGTTIWNVGQATDAERRLLPHGEMAYEVARSWSVEPRQAIGRFEPSALVGDPAAVGDPSAVEGGPFEGAWVGDLGPAYDEIDSRKFAVGEYWRAAPPAVALAGSAAKLLGLRLGGENYLPALDRLWWLEWEQLPALAQNEMAPMMAACAACGMRLALVYTAPFLDRTEVFGACLIGESRDCLAQVLHTRVALQHHMRHRTMLAFYTLLEGGAVVATASDVSGGYPPAHVREEILRGRSPEAILARHRQRLAGLAPGEKAIPAPADAAAIEQFLLEQERAELEDRRRRGICRPMTMDEANKIRMQTWAFLGS